MWISKKKIQRLEKRIGELEKQVQSQPNKEIEYKPTFEQRLQEAKNRSENMNLEAFGSVDREGFEKVIILMHTWSEAILKELLKRKDFRSEVIYHAEALKTDIAIYEAQDKNAKADTQGEC